MDRKVAWIVEGYGQNGGNYTNNIIAQILESDFGYEPRMVYEQHRKVADGSVLPLKSDYALVDIKYLFGSVHKSDILISNPNHSDKFIGLRVPCTTIMNTQGFSTYYVLDAFFTHYVSVSDFIQRNLKQVYNIESTVIPPFIDTELFPESIPFEDKKHEVLVYPKYLSSHFQLIYNKVSRSLSKHDIKYHRMSHRGKIDQLQLHKQMNQYQYILFLSIAEGFGLVPLEGMFMGCISSGFNGFGGKHYMIRNQNCLNVSYPKMDALVKVLSTTYHNDDPIVAKTISTNGEKTAREYGKGRFVQAWKEYLKSVLH